MLIHCKLIDCICQNSVRLHLLATKNHTFPYPKNNISIGRSHYLFTIITITIMVTPNLCRAFWQIFFFQSNKNSHLRYHFLKNENKILKHMWDIGKKRFLIEINCEGVIIPKTQTNYSGDPLSNTFNFRFRECFHVITLQHLLLSFFCLLHIAFLPFCPCLLTTSLKNYVCA